MLLTPWRRSGLSIRRRLHPARSTSSISNLSGFAVALTAQRPYCIELYVQAARKEGATDAMLAEAAIIAAAMRAGGAITHASHLFKE